jgi:site-specific recombinase XerD
LTDAVAGSLLAETGNDVKVVQELMRHAKVATAMEVYTHAGMGKKRMAQSRVGRCAVRQAATRCGVQ